MKSKKILGLLLACTLGFSILPGKAFAQPVNKNAEPAIHYVAPDIKTITKKLVEEGLIDEGTTEEEFLAIAKKYFNGDNNEEHLNAKQKEQRAKITSRIKEMGIKNEKDIMRSFNVGRNSLDLPQRIQEETFTGDLYVAKPLVILMDFSNYPHEQMQDENLEYKFDNYDTQYFQEMLFNDDTFKGPNGEDLITMKQYYLQQSGGSYTVDGHVCGWYRADNEAAFYGAHGKDVYGRDVKDVNAREFVREALRKAAMDPNVDLSEYDKEDRYDYDKDGNFFEPDGIIDHIIAIHAGVGEEQGGGSLGDDAIWSHRWVLGRENYEFEDHTGKTWKANDYTIQPQSGAVGVFAHEYGHDLGLPDEYDTSGNSYAGSPVGHWSIMSGGSWSGKIGGTQPTGFSAWAKEFLQASMPNSNWLKGVTVDFEDIPAEGYAVLLDEASSKGVNNDVVRINLPDYGVAKVNVIEGDKLLNSTKGDNLDTKAVINIDLTDKTDAVLKFKTFFDIENKWDWASVQVSEHQADTYKDIEGNITIPYAPEGDDLGYEFGITGTTTDWQDAEFDLSAYAGKNIDIMFRYQTDAYTAQNGWFIDQLTVEADSEVIFSENFEANPNVQLNGFVVDEAKEYFEHYYLAEWRSHNKADAGLKFASNGLEYSPGLLLWYVNNDRYNEKNHVGDHPGEGFLSVVDADQQNDPYLLDGRKLSYGPSDLRIHDAAFGLEETPIYDDVFLFNYKGMKVSYNDTETFMNPYFSDAKSFTNGDSARLMESGVKLHNYGLRIYVTGQSKDKSVGRIHIKRVIK